MVTGTTISSTWANNTLSDLATALTNSIAKDGQTTPTANLPMGGFKLTGLGTGSAATDSANLTQIQAQAYILLGAVAGTDTITATTNPVTTAYAAGQTYRFVAAATNTGAVTININSLGAKSITKNGTSALVAGDILINGVYQVTYDGTQFQLTNTSLVVIPSDSITSASLADSALGFAMINGTLTATVAANALTIAIKTKAGTDPSASDPVLVVFRNATITDGTYTVVSVTAATSLVVSSGSTLGTVSAQAARLAVILINNAGTAELAINNLSGGVSLDETGIISTTAEGGAGGADSATVIYSTTARSNLAYRVAGIIDITEATAGTWASAPTKLSLVDGQVLAMSSIGFGQTWQNVTGSRAVNTTYYNTTGRPILVVITATVGANVNILVNAVTVASTNAGSTRSSYTFIVPPGNTYIWNSASGTIDNWAELR